MSSSVILIFLLTCRILFNRKSQKDTDEDKDTVPNIINHESTTPQGSGGSAEQEMESHQVQPKLMKVTHVGKRKRSKKAAEKELEEKPNVQEKAISDVSESKDRKRKKSKTTEYYYLLERKALRMMRRYYKETFEKFAGKYKYKQNLKKLERATVDQYFREYVVIEFQRNKSTMDLIGSAQLVDSLEKIILCDRYNKNEKVTEGLDFDEVRNLLNKYNSKNLNSFFETSAHAFLYAHYYRLSAGSDATSQKHVDQEKLIKQMESLFDRSVKFLPDSIKSTVVRSEY